MKALTKTTIVIMLALSTQAAGFARRLRSPAGNMCNILGSSGVYYHSRDSAKERRWGSRKTRKITVYLALFRQWGQPLAY
jgi:hypothetical protein